jgi:hypothetical protein
MLQAASTGPGGPGGSGAANATWIVVANRITTTNITIIFFTVFSPFETLSFESLLEPDRSPVIPQTFNPTNKRSAPTWACQTVSFADDDPS